MFYSSTTIETLPLDLTLVRVPADKNRPILLRFHPMPHNTLVVVTGETLGRGDDGLGRRLMTKFLGQLATLADRPHVIAFYNAGVKLLVRGCPALEALRALDREGVELVACGTCVEHFGIADELAIGRVTDMREIVATMHTSGKVISV